MDVMLIGESRYSGAGLVVGKVVLLLVLVKLWLFTALFTPPPAPRCPQPSLFPLATFAMAKFKRKHKAQTHGRPPASTSSFGPSHAKPTRSRRRAASAPSAPSKPSRSAQQPPPRLAVPFAPADRILLVGEGDFSFAAALLAHHRCAHLTATTPDAAAALLDKHPQAAAHIRALRAAPGCRVVHGVDAGRMRRGKALGTNPAGWDTVVFNFPHVGGRSTDVNRQVRYNQGRSGIYYRSDAVVYHVLLAVLGSWPQMYGRVRKARLVALSAL